VDRSLTVEDCLTAAQEYLVLAQNTPDATLRNEYLIMAKELTALALILDRAANHTGG
jgi:hypothetical protein